MRDQGFLADGELHVLGRTQDMICPVTTRQRSVLVGIAAIRPLPDYGSDVGVEAPVASLQRWGHGRTVRALFSFPV